MNLDIPLAITGSVSQDPSGLWLLRLYFWRARDIRPLINDGLVAFNRENARSIIPLMLDWFFEWLDMEPQLPVTPPPQPVAPPLAHPVEPPAQPPPQPVEPPPQPVEPPAQVTLPPPQPTEPPAQPPPQPVEPPAQLAAPPPAPQVEPQPEERARVIFDWGDEDWPVAVYQQERLERNLLYAGIRAGWNLQLFDPLWSDDGIDLQWRTLSLAAYANVQIIGIRNFMFLGLQLEGIATYDVAHNALSFEIPVMGRATFRRENTYMALLFGPHLFVPVNLPLIERGVSYVHDSDALWGNTGWGYSVGLNMGSRVGSGFINLGVRWSNDMFSSRRPADGAFYHRHTITITVGYEWAIR